MIHVCFGTNDTLIARLVRWATAAEYSHTWIEYPSTTWGGYMAAHSSKGGVTCGIPAERVREEYPRHEIYECTVDVSKGLRWAREHIGDSYDYGVIWNALLLILYRLTLLPFLERLVVRNASKMSCSEWGTGILKNAGSVAGMEGMDPELTTTGALRQFSRSSGDLVLIGRTG